MCEGDRMVCEGDGMVYEGEGISYEGDTKVCNGDYGRVCELKGGGGTKVFGDDGMVLKLKGWCVGVGHDGL